MSPRDLSGFERQTRVRSLPWLSSVAVLLSAIVVIVVWGWLRDADSRALAAMNADLRGELFVRTRAEAEALCARPEFKGECEERLGFLSRFPECDENCRSFVARHRPRATR